MSALQQVQIGFLAIVALGVGLAIHKRAAVRRALAEFVAPQGPESLGLLRIFIFWLIVFDTARTHSDWLATLPRSFMKMPWGWEPLKGVVTELLPLVGLFRWALIAVALLAMVGFATRITTKVAAVLAVFVLGITNFYFRLKHDFHIEVAAALLLAVSPSGDAYSVDALIGRSRGRPRFTGPSVAYVLPVRATWLLLGMSYLFPGLTKLWLSGDLWLAGVKPRTDIVAKWVVWPELVPWVSVDELGWLMPLLGIFTLVFEIGCIFLLFRRTTRILAAFLSIGFHLGIFAMMRIWFSPFLPLMFLADVPGIAEDRIFGRFFAPLVRALESARSALQRRVNAAPVAAPPTTPSRVVPAWASGITVGLMFLTGVTGVESWPLASFPTFALRRETNPPKAPGLFFTVKRKDGTEVEIADALRSLGFDAVIKAQLSRKFGRSRELPSRERKKELSRYKKVLVSAVRHAHGPFKRGDRLRVYVFDFEIAKRPADTSERELVLEAKF